MRQVLIFIILLLGSLFFGTGYNYAQSPVSKFELQEQACLREALDILNLSEGADSVQWDFCEGDLFEPPSVNKIATIPGSFNMRDLELVKDNDQWYGFIVSRSTNEIYRVRFGENISNLNPVVENIGNPNGSLVGPELIEIIYDQNQWVGIVLNGGNSSLLRLNFGSSLLNPPQPELLLSGIGGYNGGMDLVKSSNGIILTLTDFSTNELILINFSNAILNNPSSDDIIRTSAIPGAAGLDDISVFNWKGNWYAIAVAFNSRTVHLLDFGTGLFAEPVVTNITHQSMGAERPSGVSISLDKGSIMAFIQTLSGKLFQWDFNNNFYDLPEVIDLGNFGALNNTVTFDIVKFNSAWVAFTIDVTNKILYNFIFPDTCPSGTPVSAEFDPEDLFYEAPGKYFVSLWTGSSTDQYDYSIDSIVISSNMAPTASMAYSKICLLNSVDFYAVSSNDLSYSWSFGDTHTASGDTIQHQYTAPGTYQVRLEVFDGTCSNFTTKQITIYEDAPQPDFSINAIANCTNNEITFTNLSNSNGIPDSLISYSWNFNDEVYSSAITDTTIIFTTPGDKNISLKASIPGCENLVNEVLTLKAGADVNFSFNNECADDVVQFNNSTSGNIISYTWDFGNGNTMEAENASYAYPVAGDYKVTLQVVNDQGCTTEQKKFIKIHALPQVNFTHELSCEGSETMFFDQTTVESANIVDWQWNIEGNILTGNMPEYIFTDQGSYEVALTATSEFNCVGSSSKFIEVLPSPVADFDYDKACINAPVSFTDMSSVTGSSISEGLWIIENKSYTTSGASHLFSGAGNHQVQLISTAENRCQNTITKEITIHPAPQISLSHRVACKDQLLEIHADIVSQEPVAQKKWNINGQDSGSADVFSYTPSFTGNSTVRLDLVTEGGCTFPYSKNIIVNPAPFADFEVSTVYGGAPLEVSITDLSSGGSSVDWYLNDSPLVVNEAQPVFIDEIGDQQIIQLVSTNAGCIDSAFMDVKVVPATLDLVLSDIRVINNGGDLSFLTDIINKGSAQIRGMEITMGINNQVTLKEKIPQFLNSGDHISYMISSSLERQPQFMCFTLNATQINLQEATPQNNRVCLNFKARSLLLAPYPNPATDLLTVPVLLQHNDEVLIEIVSSAGATVFKKSIRGLKSELINYQIELKGLVAGYYIIKISSGSVYESFPVMINR